MTLSILAKYRPVFSPEDGSGAASPPGAAAPASSSPDSGGSVGPGGSPPAPGGEGGSSPPSPTPPTSSPLSGEVPNEEDPWLSLGSLDDLDVLDVGIGSGQVPPPGAAPDAGAPTEPAAGQPAQPAQPAPPAVSPAAPAPAQPPPAEGATPPQQTDLERGIVTPDSILQAMDRPESGSQLVDWLSDNVYKLSDAEKQALDTDAVGAIPRIMSRVHLETTKNSVKLIRDLIPSMVERAIRETTERTTKGREAMDAFFGEFPGLQRNVANERLVNQFARAFRQMNPTAPRADAIKFVGSSLHAHLGVSPQTRSAANGAGSPAPKTPPFAPARPGGRQISSQAVDPSPFSGIGSTYDEDE